MNLSIIVIIKYLNKHLEDCIKSIISQNIKNYEIILASKKNNTNLDAFLLNLLSRYPNNKNIKILQIDTDDYNKILNHSISKSKGKYINIIDSHTIALENTYYEVKKKIEEFEYDLIVLDNITINKEMNLSEIYELYSKLTLKKRRREKFEDQRHIQNLRESGLIYDFSRLSKKQYNNKVSKNKAFKYQTSGLYESIQSLELGYKNKILADINISRHSLIFKRDMLLNSVFTFPDSIETDVDILKVIPLIKSISSVKDTAICRYYIKPEKSKLDKDILEIADQAKNRYAQILETYKSNIKLYKNNYNLIEYLLFREILDYKNQYLNLRDIDKAKYLIEMYNFFKCYNINYNENKFFNRNFNSKIKLKKNIKNLEKYLENEKQKINQNKLIKEDFVAKETCQIKDEKKDYENKVKTDLKTKAKIKANRKIQGKDKSKVKNKKKKTESKKRINIFKVLKRKLSFDIGRIKRYRVNQNLVKVWRKFKVKIKNLFGIKEVYKKVLLKLKNIFIKKNKIFMLENNKQLLLPAAGEDEKLINKSAKKAKSVEVKTKSINKTKKDNKTKKITKKK